MSDPEDDAAFIVANRLALTAIRDCRAIIETAVAATPERIAGNGRMMVGTILDGLVAELLDDGSYQLNSKACEQTVFLDVEGTMEHGTIMHERPLFGLTYRVGRMLDGDIDTHFPELDDEEED